MKIEGFVKAIEYGSRGTKDHDQTVTLALEMGRANGQRIEISMTSEEAKHYLPGTTILLELKSNE